MQKTIKTVLFVVTIICMCSSCAKEIYTDQEALIAQRQAQQVSVTLWLCNPNADNIDFNVCYVDVISMEYRATYPVYGVGMSEFYVGRGSTSIEVRGQSILTMRYILDIADAANITQKSLMLPVVSSETNTFIGKLYDQATGSTINEATITLSLDVAKLQPSDNSNLVYIPQVNTIWTSQSDDSGNFKVDIPASRHGLPYILKVTDKQGNEYQQEIVLSTGNSEQRRIDL